MTNFSDAKQLSRLDCRGMLGNTPAVVSGSREYTPHNALGDGYVRFEGTVTAGGIRGRMTYGGYTRAGCFKGTIEGPHGDLEIAVLDNTGGQMIIYDGKFSLRAPDIIGSFVCKWS